MNEEIKKAALEFLMIQKMGVVSTVSDGQPQSAFVFYDSDEYFNIYFPTVIGSRKHKNIQANNRVAFTVGTAKPPQTIQIDGFAEEVTDKEKIATIIANYIDTATSDTKYAPPINKLDWENGMVVYKLTPTWLRWSDFSEVKTKMESKGPVILIGK